MNILHLFPLPDEVIQELSDPDFDSLMEAEYNESHVPVTDDAICDRCGYRELMWQTTKYGSRLVYSSGPLKGKIHECQV